MASKGSIREQGLIFDNFYVHRVSEYEFHEQIVEFFRLYMYRAILNRQMDLDSLVHASRYFSQYLRHPELMSVSFEFVFGIFEDVSFVDQDIVMWLLTRYTHRRLESYGFHFESYGPDSKVYLYLGERGDRKFRNIQVPRYQHIMQPCGFQKLLDKPFVFQDLDFVKRVLRYVAPMKLTSEDLQYYVKSMFKRMRKDAKLKRVVDIEDPFMYWRYSVVRLKLILMSIDFVVCYRRARQRVRQNCINSIDSLKLFFEAIPEALVTVQDVKDVLKFFIGSVNAETEEILDDFCNSFKVEFPKSEQPYQPRSLAHYSRCRIRKSLQLYSTIPHGVKALELPQPLQNYVLLQKRAFEFHPKFNVLSRERKFVVRRRR